VRSGQGALRRAARPRTHALRLCRGNLTWPDLT
jgi:hypothetical protein